MRALDAWEKAYTRVCEEVHTSEGPVKAWFYVKNETEYMGPPSEAYLTAIHTMLEEGGHPSEIPVCHVDTDGAVAVAGVWRKEGGLVSVLAVDEVCVERVVDVSPGEPKAQSVTDAQ